MELIYAVTNGSIYLGLVDATGYQAAEGADPMYTPYAETETVSETDTQQTETEPQEETQSESETSDGSAVFTP